MKLCAILERSEDISLAPRFGWFTTWHLNEENYAGICKSVWASFFWKTQRLIWFLNHALWNVPIAKLLFRLFLLRGYVSLHCSYFYSWYEIRAFDLISFNLIDSRTHTQMNYYNTAEVIRTKTYSVCRTQVFVLTRHQLFVCKLPWMDILHFMSKREIKLGDVSLPGIRPVSPEWFLHCMRVDLRGNNIFVHIFYQSVKFFGPFYYFLFFRSISSCFTKPWNK